MIEIIKRDITTDSIDLYYKRIKHELEFYVSRNLINKAEAGTNRSEKGYQFIAANVSERIARALGCNEDKAKVLCFAIGLYFPRYGHAGIKAVEKYIADHNIDLDVGILPIITVTHCIEPYHHIIASHLYDLLYDYYHGIDSCDEIKIVRFVQKLIMDIKKVEVVYEGHPGNLLYHISEDTINLVNIHKTLMKSKALEKYKTNYCFRELTKQEYQDVYDSINQYICELTHYYEEMERYRDIKEEAVVMYICHG